MTMREMLFLMEFTTGIYTGLYHSISTKQLQGILSSNVFDFTSVIKISVD